MNYSIRNPKHSARYACHTGTSASSTARAGTSCETEQRRTRNLSSTPWISSRFPTTRKERATPRAPLREEARGPRVLHREFAQEIRGWFIRDEKFHKNMFDTGRTEEMCRKMDELANEHLTHHLTPEEIRGYRVIDLTSSKHCQPCDSSKTKRMQLISKDGCKAIPRLGGTGKNPGGTLLMSITTKTYPALIDQGNLKKK